MKNVHKFTPTKIQTITMKFTIIKYDKGRVKCTSKKCPNVFERFLRDDARDSVAKLREAVATMKTSDSTSYARKLGIEMYYPAAEFRSDSSGNIIYTISNELVLITLAPRAGSCGIETARVKARVMPCTYAVMKAADGVSLLILAAYTKSDHTLPKDEEEAETLYVTAYNMLKPVYEQATGYSASCAKPSLRDCFARTVDEHCTINEDFTPLIIMSRAQTEAGSPTPAAEADSPSQIAEPESRQAAEAEALPANDDSSTAPEGNTVAGDRQVSVTGKIRENSRAMLDFLNAHYDLRHNTLTGYTEYRTRSVGRYEQVDTRTLNRLVTELHLADIAATQNDVKTYIYSSLIPDYNPVTEWLDSCRGQWDGEDHIRRLAHAVPTDCKDWEDWFYRWFLSMTAQMDTTGDGSSAGRTIPLLISPPGYGKSAFCRSLLPTELRTTYLDSLRPGSSADMMKALAERTLVNLDHLDHSTLRAQESLLSSAVRLSRVRVRRPYSPSPEEAPRLASFIATSDNTDITEGLTDGRLFICVVLSAPIDLSHRPDHRQLFAQALAALEGGERPYFDGEEAGEVMAYNAGCRRTKPLEVSFREHFRPAKPGEIGEWLSAAEILEHLRQHAAPLPDTVTVIMLGRRLSKIEGMKIRRVATGVQYYVIRINIPFVIPL